ncbi:MAG: phosphatase PAP2 family protein [Candidatus Pacebacteria bacterium]|nr:phosphatase PAP2 family protein [Candidatus Paceibacterota bacterium]
MIETFIQLHKQLFLWMHSFAKGSEGVKFLLYYIAEYIDIYVVFFGVVFILLHHHRHHKNHPELLSHEALKEGIFIISAVLLAWFIAYLMKIGFAMPRPYLRFPTEVLPLFPYGGFDSFPSGHATLFAALATGIFVNHKKIGIIFGICAVLISLTRVISGVHFPIDILVGWILGISSVLFMRHYFIIKKRHR